MMTSWKLKYITTDADTRAAQAAALTTHHTTSYYSHTYNIAT